MVTILVGVVGNQTPNTSRSQERWAWSSRGRAGGCVTAIIEAALFSLHSREHARRPSRERTPHEHGQQPLACSRTCACRSFLAAGGGRSARWQPAVKHCPELLIAASPAAERRGERPGWWSSVRPNLKQEQQQPVLERQGAVRRGEVLRVRRAQNPIAAVRRPLDGHRLLLPAPVRAKASRSRGAPERH